MTLLTPMADFLLQAASDSAATRIVLERGWLSTVANVGQALVSLLVIIMLGMIVAMLFALKKSIDELTKLVKNSAEPVRGVIQDARDVTGELRALTHGIRGPVTRIAETVDDASGRVRKAIVRAEDRLERLDALVGVVQDEAESLVVRTSSLARGMRVGTAALRAVFFGRTSGRKERSARLKRLRARRARESRDRLAIRHARAETVGENGRERESSPGPRIRPRGLPAT